MEYYTFQIISLKQGMTRTRVGPYLYSSWELADKGLRDAYKEDMDKWGEKVKYVLSPRCELDEYGTYTLLERGEIIAYAYVCKLMVK